MAFQRLRGWQDDWHYMRAQRREATQEESKAEAIRAVIRDRLIRRLSAPKRIGCHYRLASLNAAPGFDPGAWLPREIIVEFFR
jgi:hypothetical protein